MGMAERRYGFRFSFAEGCIIVVSIVGSFFLVFLFGIYAGRELEARKAAEHTSSVRLTVTSGGEAASSFKEEPKNSPAASQPSLGATVDKPKTVVVVSSPRLPDQPFATASPMNSSSTSSQETTLTPKPTPPQNLQGVSPVPEKKITLLPTQESVVAIESLKKVQTNAATLTKPLRPSVALGSAVAEEKKQVKKEESHPPLAKTPSPAQGRWSVQVQALRDEEDARELIRRLQSQGYEPMISRVVRDGEVWYRVRVGSFASSEEARTSVERLRREGRFPQAYPTSN
jgi:cell division septation protein DedD